MRYSEEKRLISDEIKINCNVGQHGEGHSTDTQLMKYIDIANIACGGHAGNIRSIRYYYDLANKFDVMMTAYLSYPDKVNAGKKKIDITINSLLNSLQEQYQRLRVGAVKFHGALAEEANKDKDLAKTLSNFLKKNRVHTLIAPQSSAIIPFCKNLGIDIMYEGVIERGYSYKDGKLDPVSKKKSNNKNDNIEDALDQYTELRNQGITIQKQLYPIKVDTVYIDSDSDIALDLVKELQDIS